MSAEIFQQNKNILNTPDDTTTVLPSEIYYSSSRQLSTESFVFQSRIYNQRFECGTIKQKEEDSKNRQTQKYKTSIDRSLKKNFFINFKDGENIYLTERQIQKSKTFQKKSINQKILNKLSNIDNDILLTNDKSY